MYRLTGAMEKLLNERSVERTIEAYEERGVYCVIEDGRIVSLGKEKDDVDRNRSKGT